MEQTHKRNEIAHAFGGTFAFLQTHKANQKMQKSHQANAHGQCKLDTTDLRPKRATSANSTYPKGGVLCYKDSFVVTRTFVLLINICGESPALRVAANR